jgi:hypothetical protein
VGFQIRSRSLGIVSYQVGGCVRPAEFAGKCLIPKGLNLFEFPLPLQELVLGLELQKGFGPFQIVSSGV